MEVFRNPQGNFELVFPLTNPDGSGDWVTGKAAELTNDTIKVMYHNATVWTTATFSGTVLEIASSGSYNAVILSSFFTARDEDYPVIVKIVDDSGTKTWKDTGIVIQGKLQLEKIDISRDSALPTVNINNAGGNAVDINSDVDIGINITSQDEGIKVTSGNGNALKLVSDSSNAVEISAPDGKGIYVNTLGICIDLNSTSSNIGLQAQRVKLLGVAGQPTLQILSTTGNAIEITSTAAKGIYMSVGTYGIDIISSGAGDGIRISAPNGAGFRTGGSQGMSIEAANNTFPALTISANYNVGAAVKIDNWGTGEGIQILSANEDETVLIKNTHATGKGLHVNAVGGAAFKMTSATGKDIAAKEIDDILIDTNEIQSKLPVVGPIASQSDVQALSNNTRYRVSIPSFVQIPATGSIMVPVSFYFLDDAGLPFDPDSNELALQIRAVNQASYKVVQYDDEAGTTSATINSTFVPSYYTIIKIATGEYVSYLKIDNTETSDTWQMKFKFKESTVEITIPAQMLVTEQLLVITLDDSITNKDIIAKSLKTQDVAVETPVTGSVYDDIKDDTDAIVGKLPAGNISGLDLPTTVDGYTVEFLLELLQSAITGKYVKNSPSPGQLTMFKNDNITPLAILAITEAQRTRISPV